MSGGESSAPTFGGNGGGSVALGAIWGIAAAQNSLQVIWGSKAADGQHPQGSVLHLGMSCNASELRRPRCSCAKAQRPLLLPSILSSPQEAAAGIPKDQHICVG